MFASNFFRDATDHVANIIMNRMREIILAKYGIVEKQSVAADRIAIIVCHSVANEATIGCQLNHNS